MAEIAALKLRPESHAMLMRDNAPRISRPAGKPRGRCRQRSLQRRKPQGSAMVPQTRSVQPGGPIGRSLSMLASAPPSTAHPTSFALREGERTLTYRQPTPHQPRRVRGDRRSRSARSVTAPVILAGKPSRIYRDQRGSPGPASRSQRRARLTCAEVRLICDDCGARVLFVEPRRGHGARDSSSRRSSASS